MFTGTYALLMAEYNRWMNEKVYTACATLSDEERKRDRGAFFKSIHGTLNHLLCGDGIWLPLQRQELSDAAAGTNSPRRLRRLRAARVALDEDILAWARSMTPETLAEPMTWTANVYNSPRRTRAGCRSPRCSTTKPITAARSTPC